ncbi:hypothetical protein M406DRAFT_254673 [Cryphonectria parasitica EP155]|uniref:Zn(2)-C6 fungal-type domain-containing protein n=1 Tax=Cryphonectria parasitica (strain ATCC 38755 / EP155) TaxID=660469 RepID=A0A9P4Y5J2_CRYP1|nr:uncharacterized protein M406DRAFT_254673 [Cryphonectria parasitica EP155]KAF3766886.1 hypothetical protein M406DRAFT_254673 [Cryphonectria parasitica EP155]
MNGDEGPKSRQHSESLEPGLSAASFGPLKPKRVRTGCLTCRNRHLKCDEAMPVCVNCQKSNRKCERGVRLNFIDLKVEQPPYLLPPVDWQVKFQDESRHIASEYVGGLERYAKLGQQVVTPPREPDVSQPDARPVPRLEAASSLVPQRVTAVSSPGPFRHATASGGPDPHDGLMTPQSEKNGERDYLSSPEEVHYMEVFINEVAVWMDSFDGRQHFGTVIPYLALKSPMLLGAFLACGVKHLTLIDRRSYKDDKALHYYDTATTQLLRSLQNPERDTAECATTAVVLNVYEIMSEKPAVRMNHIAGARALIRECKWDARSTGIGAACFWLNVGMEILSCLACNWATAWDPDHWGVDPEDSIAGVVGDEDVWVHRIMYIVAKVANFRASIPPLQEPSAHDEQVRLQSRFAEWSQLKTWCDTWNIHCPSSMRPYAYLFDSGKRSCFPHIWLIKRSALVGRLFYHTAMCLLAQINPLLAIRDDDEEARKVQLHHAHQVCGIAAHTQDHGVASIAIRALAIAGSVLTERHEQHEVLEILTHIYRKTGWNLKRVQFDLKCAWGWDIATASPSTQTSPAATTTYTPASVSSTPPSARPTVNPLLAQADFTQPNHPYREWYKPPERAEKSERSGGHGHRNSFSSAAMWTY